MEKSKLVQNFPLFGWSHYISDKVNMCNTFEKKKVNMEKSKLGQNFPLFGWHKKALENMEKSQFDEKFHTKQTALFIHKLHHQFLEFHLLLQKRFKIWLIWMVNFGGLNEKG